MLFGASGIVRRRDPAIGKTVPLLTVSESSGALGGRALPIDTQTAGRDHGERDRDSDNLSAGVMGDRLVRVRSPTRV